MREYVPFILGAALLCGFLGTLIAKNAKRKSSYAMLYVSAALAVITLVGVVASAAFLFLPEKQKADIEVPAIIINDETGESENTVLKFEGEWTYGNLLKKQKSYVGEISIEALDFTNDDDLWELELQFEPTDDEGKIKTIMSAFFYNSTEKKGIASGVLWANRAGEKYVMTVVPQGEESGYTVIAPAESIGEALELKAAFGLN